MFFTIPCYSLLGGCSQWLPSLVLSDCSPPAVKESFQARRPAEESLGSGVLTPVGPCAGGYDESSCDEFTPVSHNSWWRKLINLVGVVQGGRFRSDAHASDENLAASAKNWLCWGEAQISASAGSSGTEGQLWEGRDCHRNSREALSTHGLSKSWWPCSVTAWEGKE